MQLQRIQPSRSLFNELLKWDLVFIPITSWCTISPQWYPPSSQCFGTDMVYQIYLLLQFTVPK